MSLAGMLVTLSWLFFKQLKCLKGRKQYQPPPRKKKKEILNKTRKTTNPKANKKTYLTLTKKSLSSVVDHWTNEEQKEKLKLFRRLQVIKDQFHQVFMSEEIEEISTWYQYN